jgi:F-box and leucine-rich repeat protein GRR1
MFHALTEAEGENDTDYDDDDYDEDRTLTLDVDMGDEGDEEADEIPAPPPPRVFNPPSTHRQRHTSPAQQYRASQADAMEVDSTPIFSRPSPPSSTIAQLSFNRSGYDAHASPYAPPPATSRRGRGFGQQPLIEPPTSPTPSDTHSNRSEGTARSNGAGFFRTYHEAAAAASSSRYHVMTPDLNFAEIGHGRGARGTSDAGSVGGSTTTLRGYDMQIEARSSTLTFPIPRRGYTVDYQMHGQQQTVPLNPSNPYHQHHPMERESATARNAHRSQRQRQREWEPSDNRGTSASPTTRELQESVQSALGGGHDVGGHQNPAAKTDGRGRAGRRGWRNTLSAAEQYASSLLFGGRGPQEQ